jgi:hypothetical protein
MRVNTSIDGGESDQGKTTSAGNGAGGRRGSRGSKSGFSAGLLTSRCSSSPPISVHRRFAVDLPLPPLLGLSTFRLPAFSPSPQFSFNATCASTIPFSPPPLFQLWSLVLPYGYSTRVCPVSPPRFYRYAFAIHPLWPWSPRPASGEFQPHGLESLQAIHSLSRLYCHLYLSHTSYNSGTFPA